MLLNLLHPSLLSRQSNKSCLKTGKSSPAFFNHFFEFANQPAPESFQFPATSIHSDAAMSLALQLEPFFRARRILIFSSLPCTSGFSFTYTFTTVMPHTSKSRI